MAQEPLGRSLAVNPDAARTALLEAIDGEPHVQAAYLFGSLVRGTSGPLSDIDVALLIGEPGVRDAVRDRVLDSLIRRLRTDRIDVVSLTEGMPPLGYRVIRDGLLVLCRDSRAVERFVTQTVLQYLDFRELRDRAFELTRRAILDER